MLEIVEYAGDNGIYWKNSTFSCLYWKLLEFFHLAIFQLFLQISQLH